MSVGGGGGGGGKYATMAATGGFGRYTSVVDRYTPGMVRYGSRSDWTTPSEMEMANSCRSFLLSRLKAAEVLARQRGSGGGGGCRAPAQPTPSAADRCNNVSVVFEQIRTQLLDLIEADIRVIRQLLNVGEQLEEIKWQRNYAGGGGVGGGGGSTSVDMSLADIESVDFDPYMTYLASSNKRLNDDVINGDDADDVFQNDDTGKCSTKTACSVQSNELRLTLTRSGSEVKVKDSHSAGSSKPHLMPGNSKSLNKLTKVEFKVTGSPERENKSIRKSQNDFTTAKDNYATAEMQLKMPGRKDEEETKSTPALEFRLVVQPNKDFDRNGQRSTHQPRNNAQLLSEANRGGGGGNADRTTEATKAHSSSSSSHHLRLANQNQVHRQNKTEETKRGALDTSTVNIVTRL